jgi:ubiquitin carboxyl-terminal hydrolase 16
LIALERVFRKRISRAQQDAHEFLQVVAETLAEEHHRLRKLEREEKPLVLKLNQLAIEEALTKDKEGEEEAVVIIEGPESSNSSEQQKNEENPTPTEESEFDGIPLEGRLVSEIECQTCGFKPKPTVSTFVVLTLPVPQKVGCCYLLPFVSIEWKIPDGCARALLRFLSVLMAHSLPNT